MKKIVYFEIENLKKIDKMEVVESLHTEQNFTFKPGMVLFKDIQGQIISVFTEGFAVDNDKVMEHIVFLFFPHEEGWRQDWIDIRDLPAPIWEEFLPIAEKGARELQEAIDDYHLDRE